MADCSGHLSWVHCVQFSPEGSRLLSCSDDQTFRVRERECVSMPRGFVCLGGKKCVWDIEVCESVRRDERECRGREGILQ